MSGPHEQRHGENPGAIVIGTSVQDAADIARGLAAPITDDLCADCPGTDDCICSTEEDTA